MLRGKKNSSGLSLDVENLVGAVFQSLPSAIQLHDLHVNYLTLTKSVSHFSFLQRPWDHHVWQCVEGNSMWSGPSGQQTYNNTELTAEVQDFTLNKASQIASLRIALLGKLNSP